jgi:S-adenosylmethionine/arginine decarboxylase-like enzyme
MVQVMTANPYGYELILDLHACDPTRFSTLSLDAYLTELCKLIELERCEVHFWRDTGVPSAKKQLPHTTGTSAICFIVTSSILIHTLDLLGSAYINIFSCKSFDAMKAREFTESWFDAKECRHSLLARE